MAEIKSTLDLIMEKTKHLTLTDGEKDAIHLRELTGKARGWIRKYLDGFMTLSDMRGEMGLEKRDAAALIRDILRAEIIGSIDPDLDNDLLFEMLEGLLGERRHVFEEVIRAYREEAGKDRAVCEKEMREDLLSRGVSGSAVVPALERRPAWHARHEKLKGECRERLAVMKDTRTSAPR